ncbi:putative polysaccharide biosynthesis protein [Clostridium septicum]|uniref:Polysaccharide biosynthesis protein n=1 Tax=Clostridium septicum TaxID=1504 RepID=A0A9N7JL91_CLOSE|nr:polysaccharide biosynthesis protein [Clostridium septicum]AYE34473.1 polysaccharide biosynthesis protein [Clostridium septicum]MDU1312447.1 polysaccharide biosynthesis protein [Clostridium septicum]QAS59875.1 polysaccharide biosynthesis protein [Clostridium septicum]UEC20885.1 polysaccharide biosynthesis protein [Clostridium septicum]USS01065.1 polysaccharide biosynthesis protein [Clostridium septicum]
MKKQSLIKASLILGITGIVARFLGLFFRWPLIMLIGDEGVGYYQMSYPLYMFFVAMASGVPVAISKMISEKKAMGRIDEVFEIVKESTILMMVLGAGTTFILFFFAKPIINFLRWDMKSYYALLGISFAPLIISFMTIYRGFFQGLQNMTPTGVSQILEQVGRVVIGVGLAFILLPKGIEYSAGGAAFGAAAGGLIGGTYLYIKYRATKRQMGIKKVKTNPEILTNILKIALPISVGATVGTIMNLIDSILVPQKLLQAGLTSQQSTILYAQLTGKAAVIVNIPLTLSMALCTSLIPIIAENYILRKRKELNSKIELSLKLSSVIAMPCMLGLFFLSGPIMKLIFPGKFDGIEILRFLSISIPFVILTQTTTSILQGTGHYIRPVINLFIGCLIKVILTLILVPIPSINIYGAVIASVSAYIVATVLNLISLKTKMKSSIHFYSSFIKPTIAALVMIIGVLLTYINLITKISSEGLTCLISIFVGVCIYGIAILVFKVFDINEIKNRIVKY